MFNLATLNHFLLVAWPLPATHFASIKHITALHILNFIPRAKDLLYYTVPFTLKWLRPWEVCSLNDPWSFAASHSLMHFLNRCTWQSSQYYIITIMMASFMHVSYTLVFNQSKCISAMRRILSTVATYILSNFFMYLCVPCYQGCGVGSPVIRLRLLAISIIRLRLQLRLRLRTDSDLQLYWLLKVIILFRWIHKPYLHFPGIRKLVLNRCKCTFISHFCKMRSSRS